MKIAHLMLACFYIDNANYQENALPRANAAAGHDVKIIASTENVIAKDGCYASGSYKNEDNIPVVRLPYKSSVPQKLQKKIRAYENVYEELEKFAPDVILCHGGQFWDLRKVVKYKKTHPNVKVYIDNHSDVHNSAMNPVSKYVLHKTYYRMLFQHAIPYVEKFLYITLECGEFMREMYHVPEEKMEYFPLGGIPLEDDIWKLRREEKRRELGLSDNELLFLHSGKMDSGKKTHEIVRAFTAVQFEKARLLIIGKFEEEYGKVVLPLIDDDYRIKFIGWKSGTELQDYLCAADLYVQPGSQSATMQNAVCNYCPIAVASFSSHKFLLNDAAFYIDTENDMEDLFENIYSNPEILLEQKKRIIHIAKNKLNYEILGNKLVNGFRN